MPPKASTVKAFGLSIEKRKDNTVCVLKTPPAKKRILDWRGAYYADVSYADLSAAAFMTSTYLWIR